MNIFSMIYIVVIAFGIISKVSRQGRKYFCISSGIVYFLLAALRSSQVGGDSFNYRYMFETLAGKNMGMAWGYSEKDPVFYALLSVLGRVTDNYTVLFAIVAAFFGIAVWYYIYRYSDDPVLSVIVLLAFNLYQFSLTGMRQTIAMSFIVFAMIAINEEKKLLPYILIIISGLFHSSALVCLVIPILRHFPIKVNKIRSATIPLAFCFLFRENIAQLLVGFISERGYGVSISQSGYIMMLVIFVIYIMAAVFVKEYADFNENYHIQYWIAIGAVFFETLVTAQNIFFRIAFYFLLVFITLVPNVACRARNDATRRILTVGLYVVFSIQYLFYTVGSCYILPYTTFWQI
ncbi:MAG: EpsG family protein [Hespellia sp.]|nr:EpsG family protein [Hespellia sp.]